MEVEFLAADFVGKINAQRLEATVLGIDLGWIGAGARIRTADLLITNQLLCQLSYAGCMGVTAARAAHYWSFVVRRQGPASR